MIPRLVDLEPAVLNVIFFLWSIAPIVTTINAIRLGFETMISQGDSQKLGELKEKGKNLLISLVFIFGSWLIVTAVINLLGIKDPEKCFEKGSTAKITFQFVFPTYSKPCTP